MGVPVFHDFNRERHSQAFAIPAGVVTKSNLDAPRLLNDVTDLAVVALLKNEKTTRCA